MDSRSFSPIVSPTLRRYDGGGVSPETLEATPEAGGEGLQMVHSLMEVVWADHGPDEPLDLQAVMADPERKEALQQLVAILSHDPQLKQQFVQELMTRLPPLQQQQAMEKLQQVGLV